MKVTQVETRRVAVPYTGMVKKYRPYTVSTLLLRLHTDEGISGNGEVLGASESEVAACAPSVVGKDPLEMSVPQLSLPMPARVAYEQALYDVIGRKLGLPAYRLLGGPFRDRVPLAYWAHEMTVDDTVSDAELAVRKGFKVFKFKSWTPETLVDRVKAVDKIVGGELALRLEANWAWGHPTRALKVIRQLERYNIECLEDPVPYRLEWYTYLRSKTDIPIAIHFENGHSYPRPSQMLNAVKEQACDYMNVAGPDFHEGFLTPAAVAAMAGVPIWHGGHLGFAILDAAFAHACAATPASIIPCDLLHYLHEDDLVVEPLVIKDGSLEVPKRPGLGVELDESAMDRYAVK